jgi:hypothetical protein
LLLEIVEAVKIRHVRNSLSGQKKTPPCPGARAKEVLSCEISILESMLKV